MYKYIAGLVIALSLTGCNSDSSNKDDGIEGSWFRSCGFAVSDFTGDYYATYLVTFLGNVVEYTSQIYNDSSCTVPNEFVPITIETGTFVLGVEIQTENNVSAREIDLFFDLKNGEEYEQELYDLFVVEGDGLYFGIRDRGEDQSRPELRTIEIDFASEYIRQ